MGERVVLGIRAGSDGSYEQEHFDAGAVIIHGFNVEDVDFTDAKSQDDIAKLIKRRVKNITPGSMVNDWNKHNVITKLPSPGR